MGWMVIMLESIEIVL